MSKKVIVIGGNHHNTLSVIRSLGQKGVKSDLVLTTKETDPFVAKSKYIDTIHIIRNHADLVQCLIDNYSNETTHPLVIACHDIAASILDQNHNFLSQFLIIPGSEIEGQITRYMDKQVMAVLAESVGIHVPRTWNSSSQDTIEYPCIVKPLLSKDGSKNDIRICKNRIEFDEYSNEHKSSDYQIQKYIQKDFEYQLIGCSLKSGEVVVIPGYSRILRPSKATNTAFLKFSKLDESFNIQACQEFIKKTGYSGLFSMEFLRGVDGVDYFMEINFRNDGNAICVTSAGVNLPYIWYLYNCGQPYKSESEKLIRDVYVMPEFQEIGIYRNGEISFLDLIHDFRKVNTFMDYSKDDPCPTNGINKAIKELSFAIAKRIIKG